MKLRIKLSPQDLFWGTAAVLLGAVIVYLGDSLLGVSLEVYQGVGTFTPLWILDLILVPFIAGLAVSFVYGLGGKILAHFSPLIVRVIEYNMIDPTAHPEHAAILPLGFWILIVIVTVEAASAGGFVGEVVLKRTYGRRPKHLIHKRYQKKGLEKVE